MKRSSEHFRETLKRLLGDYRRPDSVRMEGGVHRVWERLHSEIGDASTIISPRPTVVRPAWTRSKLGFIAAVAAVLTLTILLVPFMKALISPIGVYATVETVQGSVYSVTNGTPRAVSVGERIDAGSILRTDASSAAILKLPDGAVIEMPARSELSLEHAHDGIRIQLNDGSVRVTPAKQPMGNLYVQNKETTLPVIGGVFQSTIAGPVPNITDPQNPNVPQWEVAAIRPCNAESVPVVPGGRGGGSRSFEVSPGRLVIECLNMEDMINLSYIQNGEPLLNRTGNNHSDWIRGGPEWVHSVKLPDRYRIDAKAEGIPDKKAMLGPMLQALLEDRFRIKLHRESEDVPMYALVVAKGGLKIKPIEEGYCVPHPATAPPIDLAAARDAVRRGVRGPCGFLSGEQAGPTTMGWTFGGHTMTNIANLLSSMAHRRVVDQTGVPGTFRFYLEYSPDNMDSQFTSRAVPQNLDINPPFVPSGPDIFTAIQEQLGLKLIDAPKASAQYIVIDHAERPSDN